MLEALISRQRSRAIETINRLVPWHKLPTWLGLANLIELRETLRAENLHDTNGIDPGHPGPAPAPVGLAADGVKPLPADSSVLRVRSADGSYNDLESPRMGMAGTRFGRNIPLSEIETPSPTALLTPNPRTVSEALLARRTFVPATSLNVLAAAWIQFMTRDWFSHGENEPKEPHQIPLAQGDGWHEKPMRVQRTRRDPTRCPMSGGPPTFTNDVTHWWDASQVYGSSAAQQQRLRTLSGGKLKLDARGRLLTDSGAELTGFVTDTNWAPLSILHTLFVREHNAICDALHAAYPDWNDDELFGRARLVNAALLAKIHTVEWTPALLTHPTITAAMGANWWGLFGEQVKKQYGRVIDNEALSGIPGAQKAHFHVPYAITEEFVGVYRMHSLVPDDFTLRTLRDHGVIKQCSLTELIGQGGVKLMDELGLENLLYSFGVSHPGAMRLHNYPNHLRKLARFDGTTVDLATVDVLRDRERGLPRYNAFRRLLHLPEARSFDQLTDNPEWARELRDVYGDVDRVDILPGLLAEPLPDGMAFGDTAFRIFILMASRRLNSDRFFTTDFTPEVYSPVGMEWVRDNTMTSVLLRHCPALTPALAHVKNAFWPWNTVRLS
ncbi:MAG TPA: peroxidase family protein [Polyangiales bacterium]|nr:peroxidase family protein [Polyangiales bacterium]